MKRKVFFFMILTSFSVLAETGGELLFSCTTTNNKTLEVSKINDNYKYSFGGNNSSPDISILAKKQDVDIYKWDGIGRYENYSIKIPNGKFSYEVYWSLDKLSSKNAISSGVDIFEGDKSIAKVVCSKNKKILNKLFDAD